MLSITPCQAKNQKNSNLLCVIPPRPYALVPFAPFGGFAFPSFSLGSLWSLFLGRPWRQLRGAGTLRVPEGICCLNNPLNAETTPELKATSAATMGAASRCQKRYKRTHCDADKGSCRRFTATEGICYLNNPLNAETTPELKATSAATVAVAARHCRQQKKDSLSESFFCWVILTIRRKIALSCPFSRSFGSDEQRTSMQAPRQALPH